MIARLTRLTALVPLRGRLSLVVLVAGLVFTPLWWAALAYALSRPFVWMLGS